VPVNELTTVSQPSNHNLHAKWTVITYILTYDAEGGSVSPSSKVVTYDAAYGSLAEPTRQGYSFAGWWSGDGGIGSRVDSDSIVATAADHHVYARWTANPYRVSFDAEGGVNPPWKNVIYHAPYGPLPDPVRLGYGFESWWSGEDGTGSMVDGSSVVSTPGNHFLYAKWTANTYRVDYDAEGGSVDPVSKDVVYDLYYGFLPEPVRSGYRFAGWWNGDGGTGSPIETSSKVTTAHDHVLHAKWTPRSYTVRFDPGGGSVSPASGTVIFDGPYGALPVPVRTGYSFAGWWSGQGGTGMKVESATTVVTDADHSLYAKWTASTYLVTYDAEGGSVTPLEKTVTYNATYGTLAVPSRPGYDFSGWFSGDNGSGSQIVEGTEVTTAENHFLYAKWTARTYIVTFDASGGTVAPGSRSVVFHENYESLPTPVRIGYTFAGWWTGEGATGTTVDSNTKVTTVGNHTLYASWEAKTYTVTFDAEGGTIKTTSKVVTYGEAYGPLEMANRTGYAFAGWWSGDDGTGAPVKSATEVTTTSDHNLHAKWIPDIYEVRYDAEGGSVTPASKTVAYKSVYGSLAVPVRPGYEFSGWWLGDNGTGTPVSASTALTTASDHAIHAAWQARTYTVSFDASSGSVIPASKNVVFDAAYGGLPTPLRAGYTFDGWWTGKDGTGERVGELSVVVTPDDHVLLASWHPRNFSVSFDPGGGTVDTPGMTVTFGEVYGPLEAPVRPGYSFTGWWTGENGTGSRVGSGSVVGTSADHTLYAGWTANTYTATYDTGEGAVSPSGKAVAFGSPYGPLAVPVRAGYVFAGWWTGQDGTGAPIGVATSVTVPSDHSLFALWLKEYLLDVEVDGSGSVSVMNAQYPEGEQAIIDAFANAGYRLSGWLVDGLEASEWGDLGAVADGTRLRLSMRADHTVIAQFEEVSMGGALDAESLDWVTGGDAVWFPQILESHDGIDAAQSGAISDTQKAWLEITVKGAGELAFWWRVSSEAKYDWLNLLVDGEIVASLSGESGWVRESLRIAGDGNHLVRWEYAKDKSDSDGEDRAWLDEVNWVPDRTGFALWAYRQGLSGDMVALMASDRDGDGLANGFEFAFGENWQLGVVPLQMVTVDGRLSFDYVAQDPKTLSEVELRVFRSTNLRNWSLVDPSQIETVEPNGGRCRVQVTGSGDRAFYRLEVGLKPQGSE
jgi:uncharacterized repeat protein (TIGR02543 family)